MESTNPTASAIKTITSTADIAAIKIFHSSGELNRFPPDEEPEEEEEEAEDELPLPLPPPLTKVKIRETNTAFQ